MRRVAVLVVALSVLVPCVLAQQRPSGDEERRSAQIPVRFDCVKPCGASRPPRSEIGDDKACCQHFRDNPQDKSWIISRLL
jgi:hypothetical protein